LDKSKPAKTNNKSEALKATSAILIERQEMSTSMLTDVAQEVFLRSDEDPPIPIPPGEDPPPPIQEPPDKPVIAPDAPVQEPGPREPKRL
jgi:hypothetical protein